MQLTKDKLTSDPEKISLVFLSWRPITTFRTNDVEGVYCKQSNDQGVLIIYPRKLHQMDPYNIAAFMHCVDYIAKDVKATDLQWAPYTLHYEILSDQEKEVVNHVLETDIPTLKRLQSQRLDPQKVLKVVKIFENEKDPEEEAEEILTYEDIRQWLFLHKDHPIHSQGYTRARGGIWLVNQIR